MTAFRSSPYIDFDSGDVRFPPMALRQILEPVAHQSLDQMLMDFECRVDVWQFGPAVAMVKLMEARAPDDQRSVWAHAGYVLLGACFTYFEMIGKILNPDSAGRNTSNTDFNYGFCDVYPAFATAGADRSDPALPDVKQFRDRVRNGLYHLGYTKRGVWIHHQPDQWPEDFTVTTERGMRMYRVNPHHLIRTLVAHFPMLLIRLRNTSGACDGLRSKFREFYVDFHEGAV